MALYSLLIAINNYAPGSNVPTLFGCENDIKNLRNFLKKICPEESLHLKTLLNEEATYDNIIAHFGKEHLLKANKGDIVLIHFSGHGARGYSAQEFKSYYPDGMDENLVCYDSRLPGKQDLADKELAVLIERIAVKGVEVIVTLDCCHSGSGTKGSLDMAKASARQWEDREGVRPLNSYLNGYFENKIYLPTSRHILLAACEKREQAYELPNGQGSFTTHLLQVLEETAGNISYADLFAQTRILMRKVSIYQTPQFEPSGYFNVYDNFLGKGGGNSPSFLVYFQDGMWEVEAGVIQGLPVSSDEKALFELYLNEQAIGYAESLSVNLNTSIIKPHCLLDPTLRYKAKLRSIPIPPITIDLKMDEKRILQNALMEYKPVYFELLEEAPFALYQLNVDSEGIMLIRKSDQFIIGQFQDADRFAIHSIFEKLEHICRWEKTLTLGDKQSPTEKEVELVLIELDDERNVVREVKTSEVTIEILIENGLEKRVPFKVEARNNANTPWNCALFYFTGNYGVYKMYNEEIPAKGTAIMLEYNPSGKPYHFELNGKKETNDIFKLVASKEKINDYLLTQENIKLGKMKGGASDFDNQEDKQYQTSLNHWFALTLRVRSLAKEV